MTYNMIFDSFYQTAGHVKVIFYVGYQGIIGNHICTKVAPMQLMCLQLSCADLESFVRGGPTLTFLSS